MPLTIINIALTGQAREEDAMNRRSPQRLSTGNLLSMTTRCALGIDVSTTGMRVCVLDIDRATRIGDVESLLEPVSDAGGGRVQHADYGALARELTERAVAEARRRQRGPVHVRAVSVTATSGTVVPTDADGRQRGAAVMYDDDRTAGRDRELAGVSDRRPVSMLTRIAALLRETSATRAASVSQVVASALAGHPVAGDTSHLLKAGIDPTAAAWPGALVELAGVDLAALPELVQPGTVIGRVASGSAAGALIVAGMTDGCTSQLATGAVDDGAYVGVLGTTLVLKAVGRIDRRDADSGLYSHRAPDGRYWLGGASNVGGGSLTVPAGMDYAQLERGARSIGPSNVVCYPLPRRGERFPVANPSFGGFAVDLNGQLTAPHGDTFARNRAVFEGVALVERLCLDVLGTVGAAGDTGAVRTLSGGGTRNRLWNELRAAALACPVAIPAHHDSAYGAAVLAAWGAERSPANGASDGDSAGNGAADGASDGAFRETVARFTAGGSALDPDPLLIAAMAERYAVFSESLRQRSAAFPEARAQ